MSQEGFKSRIPKPPAAALPKSTEGEQKETGKPQEGESDPNKGRNGCENAAKSEVMTARDVNASEGAAVKRKKAAVTTTAKPPAPKKQNAGSSLEQLKSMTWHDMCDAEGWDIQSLLNVKHSKNRADTRALMQEKDAYIIRLKACVKYLDELVGTLEREKDDAKANVESVQNRTNEELAEMRQSKASIEQELEEAKSARADAEKRLNEATEREKALDGERERMRRELKEAQEEERKQRETAEKAAEERDSYKEQLEQAESTNKHIQEYSTNLQSFNSKLQSDLQAVNERIERIGQEKSEAQEELSSLRGQNASLTEQLEAAKNATEEREKARQQAAEECSRLSSELSRVKTEMEQYEADATQASKKAEQAQSEAESSKELANTQRRRADDAEALLAQRQQEHERERSQLIAERDESQYRYKQAQEELEALREANNQRDARLQSLAAQQDSLERDFESQSELVKSLRAELESAQARVRSAESITSQRGDEAADLRGENEQLKMRVEEAERRVKEGEEVRKKLHNTIQELKGNIRVFARVRKSNAEEKVVSYPSDEERRGRGLDIATGNGQQPFNFDRVFGEMSNQDEVFDELSQLVQSALDGYRVCIFAYGQTGSGKTYTMVGGEGEGEEGMIPRALERVFSEGVSVVGWLYEVYNEEVRDLLAADSGSGKTHEVQARGSGNEVTISNLSSVEVEDREHARRLVDSAAAHRASHKTTLNERSSRSHMVFTMRERQKGGELTLVDLAGSERLKRSNAQGERLKETQSINSSLSALGDVIGALAGKSQHVPFRNSKLTHCLQPSLSSPSSKCLMLVTISPDSASGQESACSLRFAHKVNSSKPGAKHSKQKRSE